MHEFTGFKDVLYPIQNRTVKRLMILGPPELDLISPCTTVLENVNLRDLKLSEITLLV